MHAWWDGPNRQPRAKGSGQRRGPRTRLQTLPDDQQLSGNAIRVHVTKGWADSAKAGVDSWALISKLQAVEAPQEGLLALMPPQDDDMDGLD